MFTLLTSILTGGIAVQHQKDLVSGMGAGVIGLGFVIGSIFMPWKGMGIEWYGAPGLLTLILGALLLLSGLRLFQRAARNSSFYQKLEEENAKDKILEPEKAVDDKVRNLPFYLQSEKYRMLIVVCWCAIYTFLLIGLKISLFGLHFKLHYTIATAIFVTGFIWIFKGGGWLKCLLIGTSASVAVWLIFEKVFLVFLP